MLVLLRLNLKILSALAFLLLGMMILKHPNMIEGEQNFHRVLIMSNRYFRWGEMQQYFHLLNPPQNIHQYLLTHQYYHPLCPLYSHLKRLRINHHSYPL